jgi:DNA polymerase IV
MQHRPLPLVQSTKSVEGTYHHHRSSGAYTRYRRGKSQSGDVDVILSNPRPHSTQNFCIELVKTLESRAIITHTLTISSATSARQELPKISLRQRGPLGDADYRGYGLDALDKALVVFLLPEGNPHYTGIHRRVDLIIAPWRAWGTAIVGWTVAFPGRER